MRAGRNTARGSFCSKEQYQQTKTIVCLKFREGKGNVDKGKALTVVKGLGFQAWELSL